MIYLKNGLDKIGDANPNTFGNITGKIAKSVFLVLLSTQFSYSSSKLKPKSSKISRINTRNVKIGGTTGNVKTPQQIAEDKKNDSTLKIALSTCRSYESLIEKKLSNLKIAYQKRHGTEASDTIQKCFLRKSKKEAKLEERDKNRENAKSIIRGKKGVDERKKSKKNIIGSIKWDTNHIYDVEPNKRAGTLRGGHLPDIQKGKVCIQKVKNPGICYEITFSNGYDADYAKKHFTKGRITVGGITGTKTFFSINFLNKNFARLEGRFEKYLKKTPENKFKKDRGKYYVIININNTSDASVEKVGKKNVKIIFENYKKIKKNKKNYISASVFDTYPIF